MAEDPKAPTVPVKRPVTKPWEPARLLDVRKKDENYTYRWITTQNLDKKVAEGWEVITNVNTSGENAPAVTLEDGTKISGVIKKRNLILCKMPKELAESRKAYYAALSKEALQSSVDEYTKTAKRSGLEVYGEVKVT